MENGVHYVQHNFLADSEFVDIEEADPEVKCWISEEAGLQTHGTTREQSLGRFLETEASVLSPLPCVPFELVEVRQARVHRDCHIEVAGACYSAPSRYVGQRL